MASVLLRSVRVRRSKNADLKSVKGNVVVIPTRRVPFGSTRRRSQPTEARVVTLPAATWELVEKIADYEQRSRATTIRTMLLLGLQVYERLAVVLGTPQIDGAPVSAAPSALVYMTDEVVRQEVLDHIVAIKRGKTDEESA